MADIKKIQVCLRHITSQHCSKGHLSQKTSERWKSCVGQQPPAIKSVVFNVLPFALIACLVLNRTSRMVCTSNKVSTNAKEQRPQEQIIISMCACLLVREHACKTTCPKLQAHLQHRLGRNPGIAQLFVEEGWPAPEHFYGICFSRNNLGPQDLQELVNLRKHRFCA